MCGSDLQGQMTGFDLVRERLKEMKHASSYLSPVCFRCEGRGHMARYCQNSLLCFACNQLGYRSFQCRATCIAAITDIPPEITRGITSDDSSKGNLRDKQVSPTPTQSPPIPPLLGDNEGIDQGIHNSKGRWQDLGAGSSNAGVQQSPTCSGHGKGKDVQKHEVEIIDNADLIPVFSGEVITQLQEESSPESEPVQNVTGISDEGNNVANEEHLAPVHCSAGKNIMPVLEMVGTEEVRQVLKYSVQLLSLMLTLHSHQQAQKPPLLEVELVAVSDLNFKSPLLLINATRRIKLLLVRVMSQ
jgi:hypothetical protein